jgi:hypothetical protein
MEAATPRSPQHAPQPVFSLEALGFETDPAHIEQARDEAARTMDRLVRQPASIFARLHKVTSLTLAFGQPELAKLHGRIREPARGFGFRPLAHTLSGTFPLLFHYVRFWVDPTGVAVLSVYGTHRWYLHTYFDDGSAICTAVRESKNANTEAYVIFELSDGYPAHMRAVRNRTQATGARPIVRDTRKLLLKGWGVYHLFHVPPMAALLFVVLGYINMAVLAWIAWTFGGVVYRMFFSG